MRALAITGMVTAFWISWIFFTGDMRATPPSRRMSEGTRSSAITDVAPASSAILACSALVTSMMTPPLSISASPICLRSAILSPLASSMTSTLPGRPDLDHRDHLALTSPRRRLPPRCLDRLAQPPDALVDAGRRHRGEGQAQRPLAPAVEEERGARRELDPSLERHRQQRRRGEPRRQREQ